MQFHALHVLNFEPLKSKFGFRTWYWIKHGDLQLGQTQIQVMAQKIQVEPKRHSSQQMWNFKSKLYVRLRIIPSWNP